MGTYTKAQYDFARARARELRSMTASNFSVSCSCTMELSVMSAVVAAYEQEHLPIGRMCSVPFLFQRL